MATSINWSLNTQVTQGPKGSYSGSIDVQAYDQITVALAAGASGVAVDIVPGTLVLYVQITSSLYDPLLTYTVNAEADVIALDALQLFMGSGAVGLLGDPNTLTFTNGTTEDVTVQVLVGRDAVAAP